MAAFACHLHARHHARTTRPKNRRGHPIKNVPVEQRDEWIGHFPCQPIPKPQSFVNHLEYRLLPDDALLLPDPVRGQRHICHTYRTTRLYACISWEVPNIANLWLLWPTNTLMRNGKYENCRASFVSHVFGLRSITIRPRHVPSRGKSYSEVCWVYAVHCACRKCSVSRLWKLRLRGSNLPCRHSLQLQAASLHEIRTNNQPSHVSCMPAARSTGGNFTLDTEVMQMMQSCKINSWFQRCETELLTSNCLAVPIMRKSNPSQTHWMNWRADEGDLTKMVIAGSCFLLWICQGHTQRPTLDSTATPSSTKKSVLYRSCQTGVCPALNVSLQICSKRRCLWRHEWFVRELGNGQHGNRAGCPSLQVPLQPQRKNHWKGKSTQR